MNLHETMIEMGDRAVTAERQLATLGTRRKNLILEAMAESGLSSGTIVTRGEAERIETEGGIIEVVPAWRFVLELGEWE